MNAFGPTKMWLKGHVRNSSYVTLLHNNTWDDVRDKQKKKRRELRCQSLACHIILPSTDHFHINFPRSNPALHYNPYLANRA